VSRIEPATSSDGVVQGASQPGGGLLDEAKFTSRLAEEASKRASTHDPIPSPLVFAHGMRATHPLAGSRGDAAVLDAESEMSFAAHQMVPARIRTRSPDGGGSGSEDLGFTVRDQPTVMKLALGRTDPWSETIAGRRADMSRVEPLLSVDDLEAGEVEWIGTILRLTPYVLLNGIFVAFLVLLLRSR
jgi:hypothetical protein